MRPLRLVRRRARARDGPDGHAYERARPVTKRVRFSGGNPLLSFDHGTGSLVKVLTFGNAEPLVVDSAYRSWYG